MRKRRSNSNNRLGSRLARSREHSVSGELIRHRDIRRGVELWACKRL